MKARMALQGVENLRGQGPGIHQALPIDPGAGAEHQVAHIVTGGSSRPKPGSQQCGDQCLMLRADAANLQVGAVGRLDHATGVSLRRLGHCHGLLRADDAASQLDPADATVQRRDDAQHPGQAEGRSGSGHRAFVQGG